MTTGAHIRTLLAVAAACLGLSACGGADEGEPIPQGQASLMERQLDAVQDAVDGEDCEAVGPAVNKLKNTIAGLDSNDVGDDVQGALQEGADNLRSLANDECAPQEEQPQTTPETTPETIPPTTETTPTTPPPTTTTPTPTTTTPEPTTPEPLPEPDNGGGGAGPPGQLKKGEGG